MSFSQTIRRVNNTPGLNDPSVYPTAQAAHDAAVDGDIIQLEPSNDPNYGELIVTKKLTILGIGYDLGNTPNTFFDKRTPVLGKVTFENGSANSSIMGIEVNDHIYIRDEKITVSRCKVYYIICGQSTNLLNGNYSYGNNLACTQNFIFSGISSYIPYSNLLSTNSIIANNIFKSGEITNFSQSVINYNVFYSSGSSVISRVQSCVISNNIFDARTQQTGYKAIDDNVLNTNSSISNNLCTSVAGLPTGSGNVNSANPASVFKVANPWENFVDSNVQLAPKSPAQTTGAGSTAIGAFAGGSPYVLSGVPNTPVITTYVNSGSGSTATPLSVTISVRSSN